MHAYDAALWDPERRGSRSWECFNHFYSQNMQLRLYDKRMIN